MNFELTSSSSLPIELPSNLLIEFISNRTSYSPVSNSPRRQIQLKNHDFDRKKDIFKIDAYSKENNKIVGEKEIVAHILLEKPADDEEVTQSRSEELKAAKSDESLHRSASKQKPSGISSTAAAVPVANLENMVIISTNRFCFYIILVFLFGMAFEHFRRQYDEFDGSGFHNSSYDDSL